jgi:hypothetical protein
MDTVHLLPRERSPSSRRGDWTFIGRNPEMPRSTIWHAGPIRVVSSLDVSEMPDGDGIAPQWHISVTTRGKRPKPHHVASALKAFGMVGAEEDNHHPGAARHFFLVCDPSRRVACQCKATEETIVDADGYAWTNPTPASGEECRGCEWEREHGKPCPIHRRAA